MILVGGAVIGSLRNLKIFAIIIHNIVNKLLPGALSFVLCLHVSLLFCFCPPILVRHLLVVVLFNHSIFLAQRKDPDMVVCKRHAHFDRSLTNIFAVLLTLAGVTTAILLESRAGRLALEGGGSSLE